MTIDRSTLTPDTVVSHRSPGWVSTVTDLFSTLGNDVRDDDVITGIYVRVPDGMTRDEAQRALTEHVAWVPLPDGPTEAHEGVRVRVEYDGGWVAGSVHMVRRARNTHFTKEIQIPDSRTVFLLGMPKEWDAASGRWFIHPDDVPTDPDAELMAEVERVLRHDVLGSESDADLARRIVQMVREHEQR